MYLFMSAFEERSQLKTKHMNSLDRKLDNWKYYLDESLKYAWLVSTPPDILLSVQEKHLPCDLVHTGIILVYLLRISSVWHCRRSKIILIAAMSPRQ